MNLTELLAKLDAPFVIRPTRRMTQGELETYLDKTADILRGNADHWRSLPWPMASARSPAAMSIRR